MSRNFNIKPSDARYIIDEDKKVVVCIIDHTKDLFRDFARKNFMIKPYVEKGLDIKLIMPNQFKGVARCSDTDNWDIETGKLIAFSRAKDKVNQSFFKRANTYVNTLDHWLDNSANVLNRVGEKLTINSEHRHNLIDSIVGVEEEE